MAPKGATRELNLDWITDLLAVGGSFPGEAIPRLAGELAIRAVVDARAEARDDEALLRYCGIAFLHLPTDDHFALSNADLSAGIAFVSHYLDRGERVLVHCEHGIGRSALLALCLLVTRGLTPLAAIELAKSRREKVSPSAAQFDGWARWLAQRRAATGADWEVPSYEAFGCIAYRHLVNLDAAVP